MSDVIAEAATVFDEKYCLVNCLGIGGSTPANATARQMGAAILAGLKASG